MIVAYLPAFVRDLKRLKGTRDYERIRRLAFTDSFADPPPRGNEFLLSVFSVSACPPVPVLLDQVKPESIFCHEQP